MSSVILMEIKHLPVHISISLSCLVLLQLPMHIHLNIMQHHLTYQLHMREIFVLDESNLMFALHQCRWTRV